MKNKILLVIITLSFLFCLIPMNTISAKETSYATVQPRIRTEEVLSYYEEVYDSSPFTLLYETNHSYILLEYINGYNRTKTKKSITSLQDAILGLVRYSITYKYTTY